LNDPGCHPLSRPALLPKFRGPPSRLSRCLGRRRPGRRPEELCCPLWRSCHDFGSACTV